jgi:aminoglycoside/choline kinase family phosphotransferase
MPNLTIPAGPEELTPSWLTDALRAGGVISEANVTSFQKEILGEGAGFMGQLARVKLQYDTDTPGAPSSLIAKFPSNMPENRAVADAFRFYEREIRFYEEIAGDVELRTPRCYYSDMDVEAGRYILLIEDLVPARVGDQLKGCLEHEAALAITSLAGFHATWLDHPRLSDLDWMPAIDVPWYTQAVLDSYAQIWPQFLQRFGDKLSPEMVATGQRLGEKVGKIMQEMARPPRTIIHGDYRLDNLFFGTEEDKPMLAVADWQIASRGRGVFDVAYFMSGGVPADLRRANEMSLLSDYHRILTDNGNSAGYDFDECFRDYRKSVVFCLVYPVIGGGSVDMGNERGVALWDTWLDRNVAAIEDLDAADLIPA